MKKITLLLAVLLTSLSYGQEKLANNTFEAPYQAAFSGVPVDYALQAGNSGAQFFASNAANAQGSVVGSTQAIISQRQKAMTIIEQTIGTLETGNYTLSYSWKPFRTDAAYFRAELFDGATEIEEAWCPPTATQNVWGTVSVSFNVETELTSAKLVLTSPWQDGAGAVDNMSLFRNGAVLSVENLEEFNFSYYPNPVRDNLNLNSAKKIENVAIYNLIGQQVLNIVNPGASVSVSNLKKGVYVMKAIVDGKTGTYKFVKS